MENKCRESQLSNTQLIFICENISNALSCSKCNNSKETNCVVQRHGSGSLWINQEDLLQDFQFEVFVIRDKNARRSGYLLCQQMFQEFVM